MIIFYGNRPRYMTLMSQFLQTLFSIRQTNFIFIILCIRCSFLCYSLAAVMNLYVGYRMHWYRSIARSKLSIFGAVISFFLSTQNGVGTHYAIVYRRLFKSYSSVRCRFCVKWNALVRLLCRDLSFYGFKDNLKKIQNLFFQDAHF